MATLKPRSASCKVVARPTPVPPPVIRAALPVDPGFLLIDALINSVILVGERGEKRIEGIAGRSNTDTERVDRHAAKLIEARDRANDVWRADDFAAERRAIGKEI